MTDTPGRRRPSTTGPRGGKTTVTKSGLVRKTFALHHDEVRALRKAEGGANRDRHRPDSPWKSRTDEGGDEDRCGSLAKNCSKLARFVRPAETHTYARSLQDPPAQHRRQ